MSSDSSPANRPSGPKRPPEGSSNEDEAPPFLDDAAIEAKLDRLSNDLEVLAGEQRRRESVIAELIEAYTLQMQHIEAVYAVLSKYPQEIEALRPSRLALEARILELIQKVKTS